MFVPEVKLKLRQADTIKTTVMKNVLFYRVLYPKLRKFASM